MVQAITALLLQTMRLPEVGNVGLGGRPIHHPRDPPSPFILSRKGEQLTSIQNSLNTSSARNKVLPVYGTVNVERCGSLDRSNHGLGQISVSYLINQLVASSLSSGGEATRSRKPSGVPLQHIQRTEALSQMGIDIRYIALSIYFDWLLTYMGITTL